jgi:hypothetical protein
MAKFMKKLDGVLKQLYPGAETDLESDSPSSQIGGFVIWRGFKGTDIEERTTQLYQSLQRELNAKELRKVSLIMPLTPREMAFRKKEMARPEAQDDIDLAGNVRHG